MKVRGLCRSWKKDEGCTALSTLGWREYAKSGACGTKKCPFFKKMTRDEITVNSQKFREK